MQNYWVGDLLLRCAVCWHEQSYRYKRYALVRVIIHIMKTHIYGPTTTEKLHVGRNSKLQRPEHQNNISSQLN
jgi:hypothetical protein